MNSEISIKVYFLLFCMFFASLIFIAISCTGYVEAKHITVGVAFYLIIGVVSLVLSISSLSLNLHISDKDIRQSSLIMSRNVDFINIDRIDVYPDYIGGFYLIISSKKVSQKSFMIYTQFYKKPKIIAEKIIKSTIEQNRNYVAPQSLIQWIN